MIRATMPLRAEVGVMLWALCLALAGGARAEDGSPTVTGRVTRVTDGDTIAVALDSGPIVVRLGSIDAPERRQPWGAEARMALLRRIDGREVLLEVTSQDRYDRLVATVYVEDDGGETDLNAWMVENGHAWVFRRFARDEQLCEREGAARQEGLGLWKRSGPKPVAPWEWRAAGSDRTAPFTDFSEETTERCMESIREARARSDSRRTAGSNRGEASGGSTMTAEPVVAEMACQKEAARQGVRLMRQRPAQAIAGGFLVEMDVRTGDGGLEQRACRFWTNTGRAQLGL